MPAPISRRFDPGNYWEGVSPDQDVDPNNVVRYCLKQHHLCLRERLRSKQYMPHTLVVFVDGSYQYNEHHGQRIGGYGCYFGPSSRYNVSECLPSNRPQTSNRAELHASIGALQTIRDCIPESSQPEDVVVITDSRYVYRGITEWIFAWRANGWMRRGRRRVENRDLFEKLDALVVEFGQCGVSVRFWRVPRARNTKADELAREASSAP
ncbi:ribonuclease H-like domain-containing protein [Cantharellus anzutake]|uniref:ribonuclease H-like domain-containing protein n=1 Tax=Cantharellus anzutake TaxID=1750568 RepID=UPI00190606ED|nr:ribonuclease H-like domain-containing protein [Cantharellus anzutake]XP_038910065.1 ribonuclease H-like domain-containing protein [Cantharellus anzutake]KAF8315542.1 ribonuclease H-like domain-containing protein [Cantharellus anzutake]KAF8319495.1 ribonuclease H-like domain-containing protein [Cantharellus anzutake]